MSDYRTDLFKDLKNPRYSAKYLSAAYADSTEAFLVALRDVARAQKGMTKLAAAAKVNRENLYRTLSKEGNPRLTNLRAIFEALRLRVIIDSTDDSGPRFKRIINEPIIKTVNVSGLLHNPQSSAPANPVETLAARGVTGGVRSSGVQQALFWGTTMTPSPALNPNLSGSVGTINSEGGTAQFFSAAKSGQSSVTLLNINP
jgi:probable addiction module antidote protein